jgi:hypothetical protein
LKDFKADAEVEGVERKKKRKRPSTAATKKKRRINII